MGSGAADPAAPASRDAGAAHAIQLEPSWKLRVGDYRVIYTFDPSANILKLITVGHRSEVYRSA